MQIFNQPSPISSSRAFQEQRQHCLLPSGTAAENRQSPRYSDRRADAQKSEETMITDKAIDFRALHERSGVFVIPNPWDAGTAKMLELLGYEALATTSAGFAFSLGRPMQRER
jgi:hypothetical protein